MRYSQNLFFTRYSSVPYSDINCSSSLSNCLAAPKSVNLYTDLKRFKIMSSKHSVKVCQFVHRHNKTEITFLPAYPPPLPNLDENKHCTEVWPHSVILVTSLRCPPHWINLFLKLLLYIGLFSHVLFSPFCTCKLFSPVLNLPKKERFKDK